MKIRLVVALVGFVISFTVPAFAQQTNTPDPKLRQRLIALIKVHTDALDKGDAAAVAAVFTENGILVTEDERFLVGRPSRSITKACSSKSN
jgi:hypothetical protein